MKNNKKFIVIAITVLLLIFGISYGNQENKEVVSIDFFYHNTCASCPEEERFLEIIQKELLPLKKEYPYEYRLFNTFQTEGKEQYRQTLEELNLSKAEALVPMAVIGTEYLFGYEEIEAKIAKVIQGAAGSIRVENTKTDVPKAKPTPEENYVLFTTFSCKDCNKVKQSLKNKEQPVSILEKNIIEENNAEEIQTYFAAYNVSQKKQQVPILFWNGKYASGAEEILKVLEDEEWWNQKEEENGQIGLKVTDTYPLQMWKVFGIGLMNGLNPCALSMLFFLLSLLIGMNGNVGKLGMVYLLGKFTAYFGIGIGFLSIALIMQETFIGFFQGIKYAVFGLAIVLAILNMMDFFNTILHNYGKIRVQLPVALRKWNHKMLKRITQVKKGWLVVVVLGLGILVSLGEFFCTGQIYAATLLLLVKEGSENGFLLKVTVACYVFALCIPSAILLLVVSKTQNVLKASDKILKFMPLIKLVNSILFAIFAIIFMVM